MGLPFFGVSCGILRRQVGLRGGAQVGLLVGGHRVEFAGASWELFAIAILCLLVEYFENSELDFSGELLDFLADDGSESEKWRTVPVELDTARRRVETVIFSLDNVELGAIVATASRANLKRLGH
jgi:hypothetical protein